MARPLLRYALVPLLAFVALSAWTLSSPVGASPDEDFHLVSIWCGQGISSGDCENSGHSDERLVPEALPGAPSCYAFHAETSAGCQSALFVDESDHLQSTARGNFEGLYPPVFYFAMNFFVGDDISRSVILMREVNAALFVGLVTALYWVLPRGRRPMLVVGTAVALVPLGLFIVPSINPSSWAVLSSTLAFPAMVGFFESTGRRRIALAGIAGVATLAAAGARADAALYAAFAIALAVLMSRSVRLREWKLLAYPLLLCVICAISFLSSGQNEAASVGLDGSQDPTQGLAAQIVNDLLNVPALWAGSLGSWGLGWLDTSMPAVVWVVDLAVFGGIVLIGMNTTNGRKTLGFIGTLAAAWVIPTIVLVQSQAQVGSQVQPRYILPLLILLAQVALFRVEPSRGELSAVQLRLVVAALSVTAAISLHFNMRRYITGSEVLGWNLDKAREWWWAIPAPPMVVWVLGSLAFGAALFLGTRGLVRPDERTLAGTSPSAGAVTAPSPIAEPATR